MNFSQKDLNMLARLKSTTQVIQCYHGYRVHENKKYEPDTSYFLAWHKHMNWEIIECQSWKHDGGISIRYELWADDGWVMIISSEWEDLDIPSWFLNVVENSWRFQ